MPPMNKITDPRHSVRALLDAQTAKGRHTLRQAKDRLARHLISIGGTFVIFAVVLIFFYLLSVVMPIFKSAHIDAVAAPSATTTPALLLTLDEYGEISGHYHVDGRVEFRAVSDGHVVLQERLTLPDGAAVTSAAQLDRSSGRIALGLSNGQVLLVVQSFSLKYDQKGVRSIQPILTHAFGDEPVTVDDEQRALMHLAGSSSDDEIKLVAQVDAKHWVARRFALEEDMMEETLTLTADDAQSISTEYASIRGVIDPTGQWIYLGAENGRVETWRWKDEELSPQQALYVTEKNAKLTDMKLLLGGISLLVGDERGGITQWFRVRDERNEFHLETARRFQLGDSAITHIVPEQRRKGFVATNAHNELGVFYTTSERQLLHTTLSAPLAQVELNARATRLFGLAADGQVQHFHIDNEHPEISWSALWNKVWYESYDKPTYTWQSSAGTDDFEAKMSLVPLAFGTMKAAFYAMLVALPIGIFGAMYTAFFMSTAMRGMVKPMVEIMAALPSVILGFLAGLWLAPAVEENLPGTLMILLALPLAIIAFGWLWQHMPKSVRHRVPEGWHAALLLPIILLVGWACFALSPGVETVFFAGDAPRFLSETLHINYEQRNSFIVGIAMGFAVIPSVFSIAEDAVFGVPKSLVNGSLALGASPWQTMVRVVLPTASPGIFSAVMIGLGRAVGETMIVLMATGNTPIMEANIFEGLRSLSANIAVEMPEAEVGSSHYRILFVSALVLFAFTLIFNTIAEVVRARLRRKYGSL